MIRHERKEHTNYLPYKCKHCTQVGDLFPAVAGPVMAFQTCMKKCESMQRSMLGWLVGWLSGRHVKNFTVAVFLDSETPFM